MITKTLLSEHNNEHTTEQIITLLETILQQNYFSFQNSIFRPEKGVSMGSPISDIITEIFLQCLENTHLKPTLEIKNIIFYTRYVNDIMIIYNSKEIAPETILSYNNKMHPNYSLHLRMNTTTASTNSVYSQSDTHQK
jgi:hypothetical protein